MPTIDPHIFRAYDIRGKAHLQLSEQACLLIGKGFGTVLRRLYNIDHPKVVVGRDARTHSPAFLAAIIEGLTSTGCQVYDIGETPSPVNYFTICDGKFDGGVQVTASHNPKEDNGLKLQVREAEAWSGQQLQELREQIERQDFVTGDGLVQSYDGITPYVRHLTQMFGNIGKGLKIVVDAGNGVTGPVNGKVLTAVGTAMTGLYMEPDGEFPNHPADPSKHSTLKDLQSKVKELQADLGIAFDGDGDRLGLVDDTATIRSADEVLLLLARDHLSRNPHVPVVFTVSNSETLNTEIVRLNGKPVMTKVGHSFVEHAMREHGAMLGGEQSGHFFCGEGYYGFDDALMAALRVLKIRTDGGRPLSELMADFPTVYQAHERRPHCDDSAKADVIRRVTAHFQAKYPVNALDGARIDFGDGAWAGIRMSNTSPCLSICIEARSPEKLAAVETEVMEHMKTYKEVTMDT